MSTTMFLDQRVADPTNAMNEYRIISRWIVKIFAKTFGQQSWGRIDWN